MSATSFLATATSYRESGLSFFPTSQKLPAFDLLPKRFDPAEGRKKSTWIGYQHRQPSLDEIQFWYDRHERAQEIALVCGPSSHGNTENAGLFVIDVDRPEIADAFRQACGKAWDMIAIERTRRGGLHLAMLCDGASELSNKKLALRPNPLYISKKATPDQAKYLCDIETRGNGGYVCVWPTPNYSLEQRDYTHLPYVDMEDVVYPILQAAMSFNELKSMQPSTYAARASHRDLPDTLSVVKLIIEKFRERYTVSDLLTSYGYTPVGHRRFRRPGGESGSVIVSENNEIAAAFSSSDPLNQAPNAFGKDANCHDAFGIYTALEHDGEVKAALEAVANDMGYSYNRSDYSESRISLHGVNANDIVFYAGELDNEVIFLVNDLVSGKRLSDQGCAALYIPEGVTEIGGWASTVLGFPQRYAWFGEQEHYDLLTLTLNAKMLACTSTANEVWLNRHANVDAFIVDVASYIAQATVPSLRRSARSK
jgi:hypothetical protein